MSQEMEKVYEPKKTEEKWYRFWQDNNLFSSRPEEGRQPFTIVIPPPNVTGSLHMGHALNNTLQDIVVRFKRMQNFNAVWVPGTDHGGIATQNVVEKLLLAEGRTRQELGREKFIERMWQWRNESGTAILYQLQKLGCSLDWNRTRFTMDEICSKAVMTAFVELYTAGLIYRGKRLVNWCPRCQTALADIEVEHEEEAGKLWHIRYPLRPRGAGRGKKEKTPEYLVVATTRPETMLGDTAVAVHPEDKRYKKVVGRSVMLPLMEREIPVIADEAVDPAFGTGAVKVTPSHDPADFEIAARHKLPHVVVIDFQGRMTGEAGEYAGLDRYEARKKVLADLESRGLLLEAAEHPHAVGRCYRCESAVEPLVSEQWFLSVEEMSRQARAVVEEGKIVFYPATWTKPYLHWLENLRDWCISRQIWWGHRIPVYYCRSDDGKECPPIASVEPPKVCPSCGGAKIEQDPDVLDTWFSSALWPFGVFAWPDLKTTDGATVPDLSYYYPTSVLVTGHEILYLWVARMVQMGLQFMNDVPFREVFIHGIVRDRAGKKMSKSLGNVVDPLVIMEKYGTDALRFALAQAAAPGRDMQLADDSFVGARNFANKIWNATRFVLLNVAGVSWQPGFMAVWPLELADTWILSEYRCMVQQVTAALSRYDIDEAARLVYDFFWSKYCDWYIEIAKIRINGTDEKAKMVALSILLEVLSGTLRVLHPFVPFITEEIWQAMRQYFRQQPGPSTSIMVAPWPEVDETKIDREALSQMSLIQDLVTAVRTVRSEMNVPPGKKVPALMNVPDAGRRETIVRHAPYLKALAKLEELTAGEALPRPPQSAAAVVSGIEIVIPLAGLIDLDKERQRMKKEMENAATEKERCEKRLENREFLEKAPQKEVERVRARLGEVTVKIERLRENLKTLQ